MIKSKDYGNEWTSQQLEAIELLASGDLNMTEIYTKLNICHDTLWRWRKNPQFMDAVIAKSREDLKNYLPEVYGKLKEKAKEGDWHHIKIMLEHLDKLEETRSKLSVSSITFTWGQDETKEEEDTSD